MCLHTTKMTTHSQMQKESHRVHQSHMEKICEICGDPGFQKALITCYQCRSADVHQYCVVGYYQNAPADWCCEECHIGKGVANEHRSSDAVNESRIVNSSATHPCDPALDPSWMGSFDIVTTLKIVPGTFNNSSIQAHPPSRVRNKVYEFSRLLLDTLKLELVPRGDIWASLFNNRCPDKEDIGLYFFASDYERERYATVMHTGLVLYMCLKDLVMRTLINDVELVILPSTTLCSDSQNLNGEHFLWGLFYRMGQDTDRCAEGGSDKVIDMEIDMIAGENVGTLDIVVSTAKKVDMEGYQNEVDMEIDMITGENVGTLDIVSRNGFDTS